MPHWLGEIRAVADGAGARVIMGVNLEADRSGLAAAEANAFRQGLGKRLAALELGNEPDLYPKLPLVPHGGRPSRHRPPVQL